MIVEVHPNPEKAWSDGEQTLDFAAFDGMMTSLAPYIALRTARMAPCGPAPLCDSVELMEAVG